MFLRQYFSIPWSFAENLKNRLRSFNQSGLFRNFFALLQAARQFPTHFSAFRISFKFFVLLRPVLEQFYIFKYSSDFHKTFKRFWFVRRLYSSWLVVYFVARNVTGELQEAIQNQFACRLKISVRRILFPSLFVFLAVLSGYKVCNDYQYASLNGFGTFQQV